MSYSEYPRRGFAGAACNLNRSAAFIAQRGLRSSVLKSWPITSAAATRTKAMNRRESLTLSAGAAVSAATPLTAWTALAQQAPAGPFQLPPLGYGFDALEPHIDAQTMMIHHDKHHAAYVNMCNEFAKQVPELGTTPIEKTLTDAAYIPVTLQQAVKNNLGGHWNHTFFWQLMTPGGAKEAPGELKSAIAGSWKDVDEFKEKLTFAGMG